VFAISPSHSPFWPATASLLVVKKEHEGFSLIEVVVVMALIALTLTLAGPRIGAGLGRLELEQAAQNIRGFVRAGRVQALRTDREHYVAIDRKRQVMTLLDSDMKTLREEPLPSSVRVVFDSASDIANIAVSSSGIVRSQPIRLRGRSGELAVELQ
jgi:prepilin-type N-terminal cleavage/methylation domain-containing protein